LVLSLALKRMQGLPPPSTEAAAAAKKSDGAAADAGGEGPQIDPHMFNACFLLGAGWCLHPVRWVIPGAVLLGMWLHALKVCTAHS
jgi:hypothetical protein